MRPRANPPWLILLLAGLAVFSLGACQQRQSSGDGSDFLMLRADRAVGPNSKYPVPVDPARVGTYPTETDTGAGYFYDEVLEYRVWLHPERGAAHLNGENDYFVAFAQYEQAEAFSKGTPGAEEPVVLVRQLEWIEEPTPGQFHPRRDERLTEWRVKWLPGNKREANSIADFLAHPKPAVQEKNDEDE